MIHFLVNCPAIWAVPLLLIIYAAAMKIDDGLGPHSG